MNEMVLARVGLLGPVHRDPVRHRRQIVCLPAESVRPIEAPAEYHDVPRRTLGSNGHIRPWTPATPALRSEHSAPGAMGNPGSKG